MKTEVRFLLAIFLMLGVLVGTNLIFPPMVPDAVLLTDSLGAVPSGVATDRGSSAVDLGAATGGGTAAGAPEILPSSPPVIPSAGDLVTAEPTVDATAVSERMILVEGPLYRYEFSNYGARLMSAQMSEFEALNREGSVDLVHENSDGYWGQRLLVGSDTVDLSRALFVVEPADGLAISPGSGSRTLRFIYQHPTSPFAFVLEYDFNPDDYTVGVRGSVEGDLDRPLLLTDLGEGLAYSEADSVGESRTMAFVTNNVQEGIEATLLAKAEPTIVEGPLVWAAFKSKFFVMALLAGESEQAATESSYLGGLIVQPTAVAEVVRVAAAQPLTNDGSFAYRVFLGPQQFALLSSLGQGMEEVNPYGWRFFQPVVRPIVSVIMTIFTYLHTKLNVGYGWVLIIFGVMMRVVLFPLNHKAMKAQLRNMSVQPLLQEIQKKYKDQPEKLQKEMMRLYKEHGFNPLAGCLPMLLPWPVLIALFFVFQNTIELRGETFLWMPDLSAPDPLYLLPVFLGLSMFLMQYVSYKSLETPNPQMKMMMYLMPIMMVFIFFRLASGLNLYYATANIATIPQQVWIARERMKMKGKPPPKMKGD
jgi:YidC/Oxa1 family membrane protein insertase